MVYNGKSRGYTGSVVGSVVVGLELTTNVEVMWWEIVEEILYFRSTVNSKGYYYLIDLNFLKASPSVFYRKDLDCIYIEWIASKFPEEKWKIYKRYLARYKGRNNKLTVIINVLVVIISLLIIMNTINLFLYIKTDEEYFYDHKYYRRKKTKMFIGNCNNPNAAYMPAWRGTTGNTLLGYGLGHPC
ncbi:hypothetical protein AGLY_009049 [Aphis glycines]|uniref:Uncharacterized protein n=1 Tax=Aphis glycines TaxID=307491 RepID=A0A6G0TJA3_APHGL|nr:hypothetical protein AGLY_009049 [Aphis glycines]